MDKDIDFITIHESDGGSHVVHKDQLKSDAPKDMRGKNIGTEMMDGPNGYQTRAKSYYDKVDKYLKFSDADIETLDPNDVKKVVDTAREIVLKVGYSGSKPKCFITAGAVAAILKHKGVKYECQVGLAGNTRRVQGYKSEGRDISSLPSNHVWIKANGKYYEYFEGYTDTIIHHTITDIIKFD